MILIDSGVWIDLLRGANTAQTDSVVSLLQNDEDIATADLILLEVLQGCRFEKQFQAALNAMSGLHCVTLSGKPLAIIAASNYRLLRQKGLTIRSSIDCLIATFCIEHHIPLLHNDHDFDPFEQHLGLQIIKT